MSLIVVLWAGLIAGLLICDAIGQIFDSNP